ncbi:MAG: MerR family transcriptional regulator [Gammaproteobacteria bacterium]|nr:MerR family transcriptional regulator [Gammaproteobacteria bacterium]
MRIQQAASQSGISAATIRYYEQIGLLGAVSRTASGYRVFNEHDIRVLVFLRKARDLGFSLDDCRELLGLVTASDRHSSAFTKKARRLAAKRLAEIDTQVDELRRKRELVQVHLDVLGDASLDDDCPVTEKI